MDFLQSIADFFHNVYCYVSPGATSCSAPAPGPAAAGAPAAAAPAAPQDQFQSVAPIETRRIEEIVEESRSVPVGCYIQMHRVREHEPLPNLKPLHLEDVVRQSHPVPVGCYIEMHEVRTPHFTPEQIQQILNEAQTQ